MPRFLYYMIAAHKCGVEEKKNNDNKSLTRSIYNLFIDNKEIMPFPFFVTEIESSLMSVTQKFKSTAILHRFHRIFRFQNEITNTISGVDMDCAQ